jgi:uncharacterized protein GlcG (DUF336 family)
VRAAVAKVTESPGASIRRAHPLPPRPRRAGGLRCEPAPETLSLELCKRLAEAAEAKASELGVPIVFAAVDAAGNPILLHRMADSLLASIDIAMNKAWSANAFRQSTAALGRAAADPLPGLADGNQGRVVLFGGGEPVFVAAPCSAAWGSPAAPSTKTATSCHYA